MTIEPVFQCAGTVTAGLAHSGASSLQQVEPLQWEAHTPQLESGPAAITREKPTQQWKPCAAKTKINKIFKMLTYHIYYVTKNAA